MGLLEYWDNQHSIAISIYDAGKIDILGTATSLVTIEKDRIDSAPPRPNQNDEELDSVEL